MLQKVIFRYVHFTDLMNVVVIIIIIVYKLYRETIVMMMPISAYENPSMLRASGVFHKITPTGARLKAIFGVRLTLIWVLSKDLKKKILRSFHFSPIKVHFEKKKIYIRK